MAYWRIRQDFLSLFNRNKIGGNHFDPIDGLRAIASLLIISCHILPLFSIFVKPHPHPEWQEYLNSQAFALMPVLSLGLEIFFILSAFLLTDKLIKHWANGDQRCHRFFTEHLSSILKRFLRFWPGILFATIVMFIFNEPPHMNSSYDDKKIRYMSVWFFFQNYVDFDNWLSSLAPLWTISLDIQIHILLPLVLYLLYSCRKYISVYNSLTILLLLTVVRSALVFDPPTMPAISSTLKHHTFLLVTPKHVCPWFLTHYRLKLSLECLESNPLKLLVHKLYFPIEARSGSFIIGAMLAIKINHASNQHIRYGALKKYTILLLIFVYLLLSVTQRVDSVELSDAALKLMIATFRPIFALSQAFILFTALCPPSHPFHSSWIRRFLSNRIWIPISNLSYLVYLIHWRIALELIFGGPLQRLNIYSISYALVVSLPIVLVLCQVVSCVWFLLVEKPFERVVQQYLSTNEQRKFHPN